MKAVIDRSTPIRRSGRVIQIEGIFEMAPSHRSDVRFEVDLPIEQRSWNIGLIVGPSGSGKSTIARHFFGLNMIDPWKWPKDRAIVDCFPPTMPVKEVTELLGSVGFSSPPAWLRPFHVLSNGEQFRVTIAHALAQDSPLLVCDEFTSVVDRTVAQIGSAAIARTVRKRQQKFIAVSCHYDIIEWLQPDWLYDTALATFTWREVQRRPRLDLTIRRVDKAAWSIFKHHHYLDSSLNHGAKCFVATIGDRPVAFTGVLPFPHATRPGWREHRTVCLPDFQGVGIGNAMSDYIGSLFKATGKPYFSSTGNPAMIYARARSTQWRMCRVPGRTAAIGKTSTAPNNRDGAQSRFTAGFEYVGPARPDDARKFGVLP